MVKKPKQQNRTKNPRYVKFGARISSLREERGLSLRALAKAVDMQPAYVHKVETGESPPSEDFIQLAAHVLNEDPDALYLCTGKLTEELIGITDKHPQAFADLIKKLKNAPENAIYRVIRVVREGEW